MIKEEVSFLQKKRIKQEAFRLLDSIMRKYNDEFADDCS